MTPVLSRDERRRLMRHLSAPIDLVARLEADGTPPPASLLTWIDAARDALGATDRSAAAAALDRAGYAARLTLVVLGAEP
jgi:hypothetical protein